jgi:hypothetical protein
MEYLIKKFSIALYLLISGFIFFSASKGYPGSFGYYLAFTLAFNALFISGFRKNRIFFDTFIGGFLWLGFWLKFSIRTAFFNNDFVDPVGFFTKTPESFDKALLISSLGALAFIFASFLRERFFYSYDKNLKVKDLKSLSGFFNKFRFHILVIFTLLVLLISISNSVFGIYQRGMVSRTVLPFKLGGFYTWLLFFGFSSFVSFFIFFDFKKKSEPWLMVLAGLLECFSSNVSMLSRGFILNATALGLGIDRHIASYSIKTKAYFKIGYVIAFCLLFVSSVIWVNFLRSHHFVNIQEKSSRVSFTNNSTKSLFIDRWVGMEGVMGISSYQNLGWDIWKKAWQEKYSDFGASFYDREIVFGQVDTKDHHFISLPGIIAFLFYPGSYIFLFVSVVMLGLFASWIEFLSFKFSEGNYIFSSLIGQVVAYRFIHFGYVPRQSYLLFGTIFVNIFLFYGADKILSLKKTMSSK